MAFTFRESKVYKLDRIAQPGDHIAVWKNERDSWHHGIYCGENTAGDAFVVDITQEFRIACRPYEDFIRSEDAAIVVDYDTKSFSMKKGIRCAEFFIKYFKDRPFEYNCQINDKFVQMWRTGVWPSEPLHIPYPSIHFAKIG